MAQKPVSSCEWKVPERARKPEKKGSTTRSATFMKHRGGFSWKGVRTEKYKLRDGTWASVLRKTLIGRSEENTRFHLRYFEIAPGGHTTFECHRHEHVVLGIRGKGRCLLYPQGAVDPLSLRPAGRYDIGFLDTLYIPPYAPHQLKNPFQQPFGFFCIVDSKRDRPKVLKDD